jgi:hypothetical protein
MAAADAIAAPLGVNRRTIELAFYLLLLVVVLVMVYRIGADVERWVHGKLTGTNPDTGLIEGQGEDANTPVVSINDPKLGYEEGLHIMALPPGGWIGRPSSSSSSGSSGG